MSLANRKDGKTTYALSGRNEVTRNNNKFIQQNRFCVCGNCHNSVIKMKGESYHNGSHTTIVIGYLCGKCHILYLLSNVKAVNFTEVEIQNNTGVKHE